MQTTAVSRPDHRRSNQSFSSSLLDAICSSLDESSPSSKGTHTHDAARISKPIRTSSAILARTDSVKLDPYNSSNKRRNSDFSTTHNKSKTISQMLSSSSSPSSPTSPGAKIAAFINSLFNTSSGHKKHKTSSPACSSCLSKTRSKCKANDRNERSTEHEEDDAEVEKKSGRRERRRILMEEIMKRIEMEYESEDDLFELEICKSTDDDGKINEIRDELPVYETTDPRINCAIAKRLAV